MGGAFSKGESGDKSAEVQDNQNPREPAAPTSPANHSATHQPLQDLAYQILQNIGLYSDTPDLNALLQTSQRIGELNQDTMLVRMKKQIEPLLRGVGTVTPLREEEILTASTAANLKKEVFEEILAYQLSFDTGKFHWSNLISDLSQEATGRLLLVANALGITNPTIRKNLRAIFRNFEDTGFGFQMPVMALYLAYLSVQMRKNVSETDINVDKRCAAFQDEKKRDIEMLNVLNWLKEKNYLSTTPTSWEIQKRLFQSLGNLNCVKSVQWLWEQAPIVIRSELIQNTILKASMARGYTELTKWLFDQIPEGDRLLALQRAEAVVAFKEIFNNIGTRARINGNLKMAELLWSLATPELQAEMLSLGRFMPRIRGQLKPPYIAACTNNNLDHMRFLENLVTNEQAKAMSSQETLAAWLNVEGSLFTPPVFFKNFQSLSSKQDEAEVEAQQSKISPNP